MRKQIIFVSSASVNIMKNVYLNNEIAGKTTAVCIMLYIATSCQEDSIIIVIEFALWPNEDYFSL